MYKIFLLIATIFTYTCFAQTVSSFCDKCKCDKDNTNSVNVTCTNDVSQYLFTTELWINNTFDSITIQNSPILSLDKQFPVSNLRYLNLANNSIVNIANDTFSNLQNMETLVLSYNKIELLDPDCFDGQYLEGDFRPLKSLKQLHLDHNRIHSLNSDIFEHTTRVEVLTLSHNPFKTIDQQTLIAITSLVYLQKLDLSYTDLASLPDYFLHTPKYLNFLDLSGNLFEGIPKTLVDSHSLTTLYFNNNPIVNLTSQNGFPAIPTLKSLHINSMSKLTNIDKGALSNLTNLEELYCFDNPELSYIDKAALSIRFDDSGSSAWPPIKKLYLQNNKLASIDMQVFMPWQGLTELDLTENVWTCECENQWMLDELMPIYLRLDETKAKMLRCAAPIEMVSFTLYDEYKKESTMRCLDLYGHRPERDGILLVGILAGVLITIPLILFIIYAYQRHWFGLFDSSPAGFSRQFYKRTVSEDGYL